MKINYKVSGTPNSPALIFSNSLGSTYHMWDELVPLLTPFFQVVQYDTRGHGGTEKPEGPYSIEMLAKDVLSLMDQLEIEKAYYCGVSMGGLIGQWLGVHAGDRFHKIVLSNTAAKIGDMQRWQERIELLKKDGMKAIAEMTMDKWFSPLFHKERVGLGYFIDMFLANSVSGYASCCHAIGGADFREELEAFGVPTLVITGDEDPVTNVEHARFLADHIPDASLEILPGKHLVSAEVPEKYADTLLNFFIGSSTFERGMHVRKTVLGEKHVDKSKKNINEFNNDFQDLVANVPWGQVWTRPGLSKHQRSLITLSMMIALNRGHEFKMHVVAAFNNGVTVEELKELILQAAIYCGFPAALDAYKNAEEILKEQGLI